jgi:glycosyltransferase involved in cell wall biosynthesis
MAAAYAQLDVLALPSRTTPTWKEQFGRVVVEALWCGVPVVGSDSGEIPWLIELTGGGLTFPEGNPAQLAARLRELRASPELRGQLTRSGRATVERLFSVPAASDAFERLLVGAL